MPTSGSVPEDPQAVALAPPRTLGFASLVGITFFCVAGGSVRPRRRSRCGRSGMGVAGHSRRALVVEPDDGGFVVWVERAFGRFWAFQEGWWSWLCSFADNALYPVMFAEYLRFWCPQMTSVQFWLVCLTMIAVVACLHVGGAQVIGFSSVLFTLLVLAPFAAMILLGVPHLTPSVC